LQILLDLLRGAHAVSEVCAGAGEAALGEGLEFEKFAVFGVEFAGTGVVSVTVPIPIVGRM
jgi:hypothetical protein